MSNQHKTVLDLLEKRNELLQKEKALYLDSVEQLNMKRQDIMLTNDFGTTLMKYAAKDLAGEVIRRYYDMGDLNITVDHMCERILHFSYEDDRDLLSDEAIRKSYYNMEDSRQYSKTRRRISKQIKNDQKKLFEENRKEDRADHRIKTEYRNKQRQPNGKLRDELTQQEEGYVEIIRNGKPVIVSDLHADHVQSRESATYHYRYIKPDRINDLKKFYHSDDNMQLIHASVNSSKSDVRVALVEGKEMYLYTKEINQLRKEGKHVEDITYKATPKQFTNAIVEKLEKETRSGNKKQKLRDKGYLDENGNVKKSIKKKLESKVRHSQNKESLQILRSMDYEEVAKDAAIETVVSFKKILAGQFIYYMLPPIVFETKEILRRKDLTLNGFLKRLRQAGTRIISYVKMKMGEIFNNIFHFSLNKFIKTLFDIIIECVKATIKRLIKLIKHVVLSIVQCFKTIADKNSSAAEKADAVMKTLSVTISTIGLEILFEYLERQFQIPDFLMEPLQIIVTVILTNAVMLILQKADLFDLQYGLLVSNFEQVFNEIYDEYSRSHDLLLEKGTAELNQLIIELEEQIQEIGASIARMNPYQEEMQLVIEEINTLFDMEIDFESEWKAFIQAS